MSNTRRTRCPTCWPQHTTPPGDPARRELNDTVLAAIAEGVASNWRNTHAIADAVMDAKRGMESAVGFDMSVLLVWDELALHERAAILMSDRPDLANLFSGVPGEYDLHLKNGDTITLRIPPITSQPTY